MKLTTKLVASTIAVSAALTGSAIAQDKEYRFVMVSHIGSNDPNMNWLTMALDEFEQRYPNVTTEYISTDNYSVQEHVRLLEQAIASRPDGIAVPIVSSDAFEGPLRKAIEQGIPVVAFNIPDGAPDGRAHPLSDLRRRRRVSDRQEARRVCRWPRRRRARSRSRHTSSAQATTRRTRA